MPPPDGAVLPFTDEPLITDTEEALNAVMPPPTMPAEFPLTVVESMVTAGLGCVDHGAVKTDPGV